MGLDIFSQYVMNTLMLGMIYAMVAVASRCSSACST